ncbi:MAG TPA: SRPBCC family protein [Acidimicrobiia bacterium]|nr:SRPBCC family protein [Acidimicrobiia bacterium]
MNDASPTTVCVTRDIAATPDALWAMVAEVTRMGEWSPENSRCKWLRGATGPTVGARFKGINHNGKRRWSTINTVQDCVPGEVFAFDTTAGPFAISRWEYRFEPSPTGTTVTETWTDQRGRIATRLGKPVSGVEDRSSHNRAGMVATLERLAAVAST